MTTTCRLATIFNADVVSYSHLMGADEQSTLILAAMHRLAADGSGYSGLITAGKEGMLERFKAHRREVVDPKIVEHGGRILKTGSEGMLVEFAGPVEAVRCAVEMQQSMAERNSSTAADQRITFRIGLTLGHVTEDQAVNISARLRALAEPGGVCISHAVRELIRGKLPYAFRDVGEHSVKEMAVPVRAYAMATDAVASAPHVTAQTLLASGRRWLTPRNAAIAASIAATAGIWTTAWWSWRGGNSSMAPIQALVAANPPAAPVVGNADDKQIRTPPASEQARAPSTMVEQAQSPPPAPSPASAKAPSVPPSIVVLPFANLSNDPDQEYFADAITDDLTRDLSRIPDSFVIARNTAFTFKGKSVDAEQVGRELGVRHVLQGSVLRVGEQIRIDARLIDVEEGTQLWADQFEANRTTLAEARNEVTSRIARTFGVELDKRAITPVDPNVRDFIMRGWAWYHRPYSAATWEEARRDFERALELDPGSVDGRIGLAMILSGKLAEGWTPSLQQDVSRADQLLGEALEHVPDQAPAHFAMGVLRQMQNRLPEAQAEYEAAVALDHNYARAYLHLGQTLMFLGEPEAGTPHIEKAIRLNPNDPNASTAYWAMGTCYLLLGRLDEAVEALSKARAANARLWFPYLYLAGAFGLEGNLDEARLALTESTKLNPAIKSIARMRGQNPWLTNPRHWALQEQTLNVGLQRAGLPQE